MGYLLKARKVDMVRGRGRLTGPRRLVVETADGRVEIDAKAIILATGCHPQKPGLAPWDSPNVWTTEEAARATTLPESVLIVGGGVIGCEFATAYGELGIPTTLVEMLPRLVGSLDPLASTAIAASLKVHGVTVLTGTRIAAMTATPCGIRAEIEGGQAIEAQRALVAVGRKPNVDGIGLESVGVQLADGVIRVDSRCGTNVEGVYAAGDVAERRQYAHLASRMGLVAADNATGFEAHDDRSVVPEVVYTHPQVASVGLSEEQARTVGQVHLARFPYRANGMANACGQTEGQVMLIAAPGGDGRILGACVIGQGAGDVVQEIALALRNDLTVRQVADTIHAPPTFVEAVGEVAEAWLGLPLHVLSA